MASPAPSSKTTVPSPAEVPAAIPTPQPPVKHLILDAGPLLSLAPLRGMAATYHTTPGVLDELRDPRAREHWERLAGGVGGGLAGGVQVREPDAASVAKVSAFAKATGDYAVLSKVDLQVLALTFMLEVEENGYARVRDEYGQPPRGGKAGKTRAGGSEAAAQQGGDAVGPSASVSASNATKDHAAAAAAPEAGPSVPRAPPKNPWNIVSPHTLGAGSSAPADAADAVEHGTDDGEDDEVGEMDEDEYPTLGGEVFRGRVEADAEAEAAALKDERRTWSGPVKGVRAQATQGTATATAAAQPIDDAADHLVRTTLADEQQPSLTATSAEPLYAEEEPRTRADEDDSDDGEWITPANVAQHKSLDLGLVPAAADDASGSGSGVSSGATGGKKKKRKGKGDPPAPPPQMKAACMTGDYAVQNVLLQMGLNLVGEQGKRIGMVKSWVLRCHACFKICKDQSKKFCPSCGNPTLIRASVSTQAADGAAGLASADAVQVHLKPNFQYRTRGSVYSIPQPKMGAAKGQNAGGSGLILREDQKELMSAVRREEGRRAKEERALARAVKNEAEGKGHLGGWNDPDWLPEMLVVGLSGKGRRGDEQLPDVGYGRRNPNQVRRKKK